MQLANDFFAQAVVVTKGFKQRAGVQARLEKALADDFDDVIDARQPAGARAPGRLAAASTASAARTSAVARARAAARAVLGAQPEYAQHQLRLERAAQGDPRRGRPGPARPLGISSQQLANNINAVVAARPSRSCATAST